MGLWLGGYGYMWYIVFSNDVLLFYMMINGLLGLKIIVLIVDNFKDNFFFKD